MIPTYEEARNVGELLPRLAAMAAENPDFRITAMIVDDSSPDGTADLARSIAPSVETESFRVRVETRAEKAGLGAAYIWAFERLLGADEPPTHILQMDADLSHDPSYITEMLRRVRGGADLVVASRYIRAARPPTGTSSAGSSASAATSTRACSSARGSPTTRAASTSTRRSCCGGSRRPPSRRRATASRSR